MDLGGLVDDLVHDDRQEVAEHDVDHGTQTSHRSTDTDSAEPCFGDGCVEHALGSKFFDKP